MAYTDYRHCDVCDRKTFYDAELSWNDNEEDEEHPGVLYNNKPTCDTLDNLGNWAVLCVECSKTHKLEIVKI